MISQNSQQLRLAVVDACSLGRALIGVLKANVQEMQNNDQILPASVITAKHAFDKAQADVIKLLGELSSTLTEQDLLSLNELQAVINLLATASLDGLMEDNPDSVELLYEHAGEMLSQGRDIDAVNDYQLILEKDPTHFGALNDLGKLHMESGRHKLAKDLISLAVSAHPDIALGHINLADLLLFQSDYLLAKKHYQTAIDLDAKLYSAHQGLALALAGIGDEMGAQKHRELGFRGQSVITWVYRGTKAGIPLLILSSALGGNISIKHVLDKRIFHSTVVLSEYFDVQTTLPPHQLVINLIGDADLCEDGLSAAELILANNSKPVLNHPSLVKNTGRLQNSLHLSGVPGVITPTTLMLTRAVLQANNIEDMLAAQGISFPLLLRSPGFHTGQFFLRVEIAKDLYAALATIPGDELLVIKVLDARHQYGDYHKYRVMFVDGVLYPLHLAISEHWKIHYFSASMDVNPEYRRLETAFLENMPEVLGEKAMQGLEGIRQSLGLDYGGIDFAVGPEGDVLLFEANATMAVHRPDELEKWAYRRAATERVLDAVRNMVINRANGGVAS
jgi:hypothetical protein